jgi:hypothetical protein
MRRSLPSIRTPRGYFTHPRHRTQLPDEEPEQDDLSGREPFADGEAGEVVGRHGGGEVEALGEAATVWTDPNGSTAPAGKAMATTRAAPRTTPGTADRSVVLNPLH